MVSFSQSGMINARIEKVFAVVSDPKRIPEWRNDVPRISQISGESKVGTTFVEEVHFMGTKHLLMRITEHVPNKKLVIAAQSGISILPVQTFIFDAKGNTTRLEVSVLMKTSGFVTMIEFMLPGQLKKHWEKYFINLDQLLSR